jgi:hypothetical protein
VSVNSTFPFLVVDWLNVGFFVVSLCHGLFVTTPWIVAADERNVSCGPARSGGIVEVAELREPAEGSSGRKRSNGSLNC